MNRRLADGQLPAAKRPVAAAGFLVTLSVRLLPIESRDRYDDEFRADLCVLPRRRHIPQAVGLLVGAISLRAALKEHQMSIDAKSVTYWKCRLGRHRYRVMNDANPENRKSTHLECSRCLKFKEITEYEPTNGRYLTGGGIGM